MNGLCCCFNLFIRGVQFSIPDIVPDGAGKQEIFLGHNAKLSPQAFQGHFLDILSINVHGSAVHIKEPGNEIDNGGLSGSRWAYQSNALPRLYLKAYIF